MLKLLLLLLLFCKTLILHASPLPANEVFQVDVERVDPNTLTLYWHIKPHYFLYSDRIKLSLPKNSNVQLGNIPYPPALTKTDKQGTTHKIYRNELNLPVGILGEYPGEALINLQYQGCSDEGFCYPTEKRQIKVSINNQRALTDVSLETSTPVAKPETPANTNIAQMMSKDHWIITLITFFGFGLLLSFTPCILPMVPVLSGIIVGHGSNVTTRKAFFLSLSYVLSMSVTYAVFGALVALVGANLQIMMQSPWAIGLFSLLFVLLALSMFGFYEFKLPLSWQAKISGSSQSQRGGHYLGAAIMGCLSTLILSPCVTAPLIGVLTYIAQTGNVLIGTVTLFVLGLGMGTPLLLIGTSAGRWLPSAGSWMITLKTIFGLIFLAVAIYLLSRIILPNFTMALWATLLIFSGIYAGAFADSHSPQEKFSRGLGIISFSYGLLILIGTSMGNTNPLLPLAHMQTSYATETKSVQKQSLENIESAIREASGKPVMLDFYADWCASCQFIEGVTFKDPEIATLLKQFDIIKVDLTSNNNDSQKIMQHFKVIAPPTFIFFNKDGKLLDHLTIVGESSTKEFIETFSKVNKGS